MSWRAISSDPVQLLVRAQVREDPPRELDAARADDRDLRHAASLAPGPSGASTSTGNVPGVIVCVAANPSIDKLFEVERLVAGEIHRPLGFVQTAGGKGLERGARRAPARWRRAGRRDPARSRGEMARGDPAGRGDRRRVRLDPRGEPLLPVGRRPERRQPHGVLRARSGRAGRRVDRAGGGREPAVPPRRVAHDLGLDPAGAVRRWLPRPGGGGASGRDAGGAGRGGRATASRRRGGTGDREGEHRGG